MKSGLSYNVLQILAAMVPLSFFILQPIILFYFTNFMNHLSIIIVIIISAGIYITYNNSKSAHYNTAFNFFKLYYSKDNYNVLKEISSITDTSEDIDQDSIAGILENLYRDKYEYLLAKEAYERLAANRIILEPEQIVKDFDCTLELINIDMKKESKTAKGNPVYSFSARIKATFPNKENKEFVETGTIEFFREDNQWKVNRLDIDKKLYKSIKNSLSGS